MKKSLLAILLSTTLLQGCVGVFLAGAAAGGLVVYDRRSITTFGEDQNIRHRILNKIQHDETFKNSHFVVSSFNHNVLIAGQTPHDSTRVKVERIAQSTPKVRRVFNEITIGAPTPAMARSNDSWITTKIKSKMLTTKSLKSGAIKVVTENRTVYLMGHVTRSQADLAVDVARRVAGVKKVVKVFEYRR